MARKPRSEWSPAYRVRMDRAAAQGKTRQQARGHKAGEHIQRKEAQGARPLPVGRASTSSPAIKPAAPARADPDEAARRLKPWVREKGAGRFNDLTRSVKRREVEKRERERPFTAMRAAGGSRCTFRPAATSPGCNDDFEDFDLPDMPDADDFGWLFYH